MCRTVDSDTHEEDGTEAALGLRSCQEAWDSPKAHEAPSLLDVKPSAESVAVPSRLLSDC